LSLTVPEKSKGSFFRSSITYALHLTIKGTNLQSVTFFIAAIATLIVLLVNPLWSIVVYCVVLAWYPIYLTVQVGTIDFTVCRIVILVIYLNLFLKRGFGHQLTLIWPDKLIMIYFVCQFAAGAANVPLGELLENLSGAAFDIVLPYFAVRLIVNNKKQYLTLLKSILVITAPLALVGMYESLTGYNPVSFLQQYCTWWSGAVIMPNPRSGFYRAFFCFPHPITFGLFFAIFGPVCAGLLHNIKASKLPYIVGLALMALGVWSSMSSGPYMAALFAIVFIAGYRFRQYSKAMFVAAILFCLLVEIISNRHFFEVIDRYTFNSATAWYRSKLIEVALFEGGMAGHWLTGFGFQDPGWGPKMDGRASVDIVNHYILVLSKYGLVGLVPFLALIMGAAKKLIEAYRVAVLESDQWLIWCLAGGLFGVLAGMNSVSLFGQPRMVFYMMLGFCAVMPTIVGQGNSNLVYIRQP